MLIREDSGMYTQSVILSSMFFRSKVPDILSYYCTILPTLIIIPTGSQVQALYQSHRTSRVVRLDDFVIWTQCYVFAYSGAYTTITILFSLGGKIRERKISRNPMRSGYLFRCRKFSAKSKFANRPYSEKFLHAKNTCYTVRA